MNLKYRIHNLFDPKEHANKADRITNYFIIILIILNVIAVALETVDSIYVKYQNQFIVFEYFSVVVFSVEYLARIWSCTIDNKYSHPVWGRIKYLFSIGSLIDLLAILPFYLPLAIGVDLRSLRILRLIRFLRFFKMGRYTKASRVITSVVSSKKEEILLSFLITLFLVIAASTIMYYAENEAQPELFSSIPATMWWSVSTLTTVGYGDIIPITSLGKFLTGCISIIGIGMFALPAGILASGFSDEFSKNQRKRYCPNCGKEL